MLPTITVGRLGLWWNSPCDKQLFHSVWNLTPTIVPCYTVTEIELWTQPVGMGTRRGRVPGRIWRLECAPTYALCRWNISLWGVPRCLTFWSYTCVALLHCTEQTLNCNCNGTYRVWLKGTGTISTGVPQTKTRKKRSISTCAPRPWSLLSLKHKWVPETYK
jgi:hypothetical protein